MTSLQLLLEKNQQLADFRRQLVQSYTKGYQDGLLSSGELDRKLTGISMSEYRLYTDILNYLVEKTPHIPASVLFRLVFAECVNIRDLELIDSRYADGESCPLCGEYLVFHYDKHSQGYEEATAECPRGCDY